MEPAMKLSERIRERAKVAEALANRGEGEAKDLDNAIVSEGDDNGAYVMAWVWADFNGTPLNKRRKR